jgi:hypothetical protein
MCTAAFFSLQCRAVLRVSKSASLADEQWGLQLSTKQAELLRVLFSMGLTAFVGAGTFVVIRYLTGLSE